MPAAQLKSYAQKAHKSLKHVEAIWDAAKKAADKAIGKKGPRYWAYVNATTRKRLGLVTESTTFKEYVDLSFEPGPVQNAAANAPMNVPNVPANIAAASDPLSEYAKLIAGIFAARDKAHELHLATHSYAQHVALNELYDALLKFADGLAEMYQGKHGLLAIDIQADDCFRGVTDPNAFIQQLVNWLEGDGRTSCGSDSFIVNKYEEMLGEIYRAKYKLNYLA